MSWQDDAACKDENPEAWFPEKSNLALANDAILACFTCPVRKECDEYKKETGSNFGIWAGKFSER